MEDKVLEIKDKMSDIVTAADVTDIRLTQVGDITGMQGIMNLISHAISTEKWISFTWYSRGVMTDMVLLSEQKRMIFGIELQEVKHSG